MRFFIQVKFKEFKMTPKSKEFEISLSLYIMRMLNYLFFFQILQNDPHLL